VSAWTQDRAIHFGSGFRSLPKKQLERIVAHESVHVAQSLRGGKPGRIPDIEVEAHELAADLLAGQPVHPRFQAPRDVRLADTPYDKVIVERAKQRLELLKKFVAMWEAREIRRTHTSAERDPLLENRKKMDRDIPGPPGLRARMEAENLAALNRRALRIDVNEERIVFHVNFEVSFEDEKMESLFSDLKVNVLRGIEIVWNQKLKGPLFGGRKLVVEPEFNKVKTGKPRDLRFWLIAVRATDDGVVKFPGCQLDQPSGGVPTSVTDSNCAGGVMSIPPLHVKMPGVLGHEMLHLFGLIDRYAAVESKRPGKRSVIETFPSRETGGRRDPLGAEDASILHEDLAFLFDKLGVYTMEENRGLEALGSLEKEGMTILQVRGEIHRQEEIIRLGHDPNSLLPIRKDFKDKILRDADKF
jgi:hypothetical protein